MTEEEEGLISSPERLKAGDESISDRGRSRLSVALAHAQRSLIVPAINTLTEVDRFLSPKIPVGGDRFGAPPSSAEALKEGLILVTEAWIVLSATAPSDPRWIFPRQDRGDREGCPGRLRIRALEELRRATPALKGGHRLPVVAIAREMISAEGIDDEKEHIPTA